MTKKWYNYFVSVDEAEAAGQSAGAPKAVPTASKTPAQSIAEIASSVAAEPKFTTPISDPTSFDEIYKAAEIPPAPQGYSILKVAHMLESEHIRNLATETKRASLLMALEAAGVQVDEVLQDATLRQRSINSDRPTTRGFMLTHLPRTAYAPIRRMRS